MQTDGSGRVRLSVREAQVLKLLCTEGLAYKEIAHKLKISSRTVAGHVEEMSFSLALSGRNILQVWGWQHPQAMEGEWVDPEVSQGWVPLRRTAVLRTSPEEQGSGLKFRS